MSAFVNCHKVTVPFASFVFCHREVMLDTWEALFFPPMFLVLTRGAFSSAEAAKQKSIFFKAFSISAAEGTGIGGASFFVIHFLLQKKMNSLKNYLRKHNTPGAIHNLIVYSSIHKVSLVPHFVMFRLYS